MNEQITIRPATEDDAAALLAIYAPYILETAITFEYTIPSVEEFAGRIRKTKETYPYFVAEIGGVPVGYVYASRLRPRAAYEWAVETSIYVEHGMRGRGVGRALYEALETALAAQNVRTVYACITHPNEASVAFHERLGFHTVGLFQNCAYKSGQWLGLVWMEKSIGDYDSAPAPLIPFSQIGK